MESIKEEFHHLIDSIEDEAYLQDLFKLVASLTRRQGDVLDDLFAVDMQKLDNALGQIKTGQVVSDTVMRQRYMVEVHPLPN